MAQCARPGAEDYITVRPLGGGMSVGRSCILVNIGGSMIMLDCGMHVGYTDHNRYPDFSALMRNGKSLTNTITAVLVTHFHLDHCGALPYLTEQIGYNGPIYMTPPTKAICPALLQDYRKVMLDKKGVMDMYSESEIEKMMSKVRVCYLKQTFQVGRFEITPYYAGHVLGAVAFEIKHTGAKGTRSVVYTGDYSMTPERHLGAAKIPMTRPDLLISESTYADTIRGSKKKREVDFLNAVKETVIKQGKVLIPVFAVGRIQEMCLLLQEFWEQQGMTVPIYITKGLTTKAHKYYQLFLDWTHESIVDNFMATGTNRLAFHSVKAFDPSLITAPGPMVVFASPGMLSGGMSLKIFKSWASESCNLTVLPGFCVPGTVGSSVLRGDKTVRLDHHTTINIRCRIALISFSMHTDLKGILSMINRVRPSAVLLVHGQKRNILTLKEKVEKQLRIPCLTPSNTERALVPLHPTSIPTLASISFLSPPLPKQTEAIPSQSFDTKLTEPPPAPAPVPGPGPGPGPAPPKKRKLGEIGGNRGGGSDVFRRPRWARISAGRGFGSSRRVGGVGVWGLEGGSGSGSGSGSGVGSGVVVVTREERDRWVGVRSYPIRMTTKFTLTLDTNTDNNNAKFANTLSSKQLSRRITKSLSQCFDHLNVTLSDKGRGVYAIRLGGVEVRVDLGRKESGGISGTIGWDWGNDVLGEQVEDAITHRLQSDLRNVQATAVGGIPSVSRRPSPY